MCIVSKQTNTKYLPAIQFTVEGAVDDCSSTRRRGTSGC